MNPTLIVLSGLAQLFILFRAAPWTDGLIGGLLLTAVLAIFAYTRLRWDAHLDMFLAMIGPGGLGMLLLASPHCHDDGMRWSGFWMMSVGMLLASVPSCWLRARCVLEARREGRGLAVLLIDIVGMEIGMASGGWAVSLTSSTDPRLVWFHHGLMLTGMLIGMLGASALQARRTGPGLEIRGV